MDTNLVGVMIHPRPDPLGTSEEGLGSIVN